MSKDTDAQTRCAFGHPLEPVPAAWNIAPRRHCPQCHLRYMQNYRAAAGPEKPVAHKSHCKHGHPLSGENLYVSPSGEYSCYTCRAMWKRCVKRPMPTHITHCKRGHPMSGENLRINRSGSRSCRACQVIHCRESRRKKKESTLVAWRAAG